MAWEGLGGSIDPGQSLRWWYGWGGYKGVQVARARPLNPGSELRVSGQGQKLKSDGGYRYYVTVKNVGSFPVNYHLTGGAL